jgi:lysosomal alpha-mannosidase
MEWLWKPFYNSLGERVQILAHSMYDTYCPPKGFNFDRYGYDDPFEIDDTLSVFNAEQKTQDFIQMVNERSSHYRTNHLLIPMGCDFQYTNANQNFYSMDNMITYINARYPNMTLFYSTPSEYIKAIKEADLSWPTRYDDMFPYADIPEDYWTGYFTSRANSKK